MVGARPAIATDMAASINLRMPGDSISYEALVSANVETQAAPANVVG